MKYKVEHCKECGNQTLHGKAGRDGDFVYICCDCAVSHVYEIARGNLFYGPHGVEVRQESTQGIAKV
jgi:hypothetical protein